MYIIKKHKILNNVNYSINILNLESNNSNKLNSKSNQVQEREY